MIRDASITSHQSPITNHQSPITNHQLPITNYQLPITNYQSNQPQKKPGLYQEPGLRKKKWLDNPAILCGKGPVALRPDLTISLPFHQYFEF